MTYDDTNLNKGQLRKLNAIRKSVHGDEKAAQAMFKIYKDAQPKKNMAASVDEVAITLQEALASLARDNKLNLGRYGYTVKRAKGKGASGFVATRNEK